MSHKNQLSFVQACSIIIKNNIEKVKIVEIGSYDVNGSIREYFNWVDEYVGVDLISGPSVDEISSGHEYGISNYYDVSISTEVFEHNPYWLETLINMIRITKPNGLIIFTCASKGRLEHGTERTTASHSPGTSEIGWSYYKNLDEKDIQKKLNLSLNFIFHKFYTVKTSKDLYFIGIKKSFKNYEQYINKNEKIINEINIIEKLVFELNKPVITKVKKNFPILSAIRMMPLNIGKFIFTDQYYQDFYLKYFRLTEKLKENLIKNKEFEKNNRE